MNSVRLRTVKQVAAACPAFSVGSLRWHIFNAESNGLRVALVKVGGRVYIDLDRFEQWLETQRLTNRPAGPDPRP